VLLEACKDNRYNFFTREKNFILARIADKFADMGNFDDFENSSGIEDSSTARLTM
jgi:hypothetical protein